MPCGVGVPAQTPLFETQKQYAGAAGEAESPDAVEMGSPLRIEWDRIRQRALSWTWGDPSDAAHQISTPHVQGTDWNRPTSGPAHSGKRMGGSGLRLWEGLCSLGHYGVLRSPSYSHPDPSPPPGWLGTPLSWGSASSFRHQWC